MSHFLEKGREVLNSQPFSCLLGTELTGLSEGTAELSLPIREELKQSYGFVHGGVVSYLADNCLTFAAATVLGHCVTSEYKINYLMPSVGEKLVAKSTVLSFALRQAVCECKVYAIKNGEHSLVAAAQGTIVKVETDSVMKN
ncbi:PaaI family thioesterase [Aliikangiella coralliicola]|uniref:Medium/long-chain acyl-CoA thioesterase YigI n=1 Tax=Aliikangiella coralliicola TaxID=2592383 RepID=A0A545U938_9GAMM|nr:PaaI family thioesterase [Aliikangiella coralliicola]TQV85986.1 PaaI family thioesterase [Aliikangiella coralliicola]